MSGLLVPIGDAHAFAAYMAPDDEPEPIDIEERNTDQIRAMLALLPPLEAALVIYDLEGRSHGELARVLGVSRQAVSYRVRRARVRLAWLATWPGLALTRNHVRVVCMRHLPRPLRSTVLEYWPRGRGLSPTLAATAARRSVGTVVVYRRLRSATSVLIQRAAGDEDALELAAALVMLLGRYILRDGARRRVSASRLSRLGA